MNCIFIANYMCTVICYCITTVKLNDIKQKVLGIQFCRLEIWTGHSSSLLCNDCGIIWAGKGKGSTQVAKDSWDNWGQPGIFFFSYPLHVASLGSLTAWKAQYSQIFFLHEANVPRNPGLNYKPSHVLASEVPECYFWHTLRLFQILYKEMGIRLHLSVGRVASNFNLPYCIFLEHNLNIKHRPYISPFLNLRKLNSVKIRTNVFYAIICIQKWVQFLANDWWSINIYSMDIWINALLEAW